METRVCRHALLGSCMLMWTLVGVPVHAWIRDSRCQHTLNGTSAHNGATSATCVYSIPLPSLPVLWRINYSHRKHGISPCCAHCALALCRCILPRICACSRPGRRSIWHATFERVHSDVVWSVCRFSGCQGVLCCKGVRSLPGKLLGYLFQ